MQNFSEIQQQVFYEAQEILKSLTNINSKASLIEKQNLVAQLQDLISFLKISNQYQSNQEDHVPLQIIENQEENYPPEKKEFEDFNGKYIAEEEVIFNNELNQIDDSEIDHPEVESDHLEEEAAFNNDLNEIDDTEFFEKEQDSEKEEILESNNEIQKENSPKIEDVDEKEKTIIQENEEVNTPLYNQNRGKIIEFIHEEKEEKIKQEDTNAEQVEEKRFRLANIKGLKKIQELFDDDPFEKIEDEKEEITKEVYKDKRGSLLKSNIPTDFMEAEKSKPEFKLDLNDKIAFSKALFGGNQNEMNEAIKKLNSFKTIDEAKEYLSEVYYERKWENADEYAQRLWSLVENKFL